MQTTPAAGAGVRSVPLGFAAALVGASVFFGGGGERGQVLALGSVAFLGLVSAVAAIGLSALPRPRIGREGAVLVSVLGGLVAWNAVSLAWSIQPDRTWDVVNRDLAYGALLLVGSLTGPRAPRRVAALLAAVLAAAVAWALLGKILPGLGPDATRSARLRAPVGYWNALALLVASALPLWLWLASSRRHAALLRAAAVVALYASLVALLLTASRGGVVVAAVAVAVWLAVGRSFLEGTVALGLALPPALAVGWWAFRRSDLVEVGVVDDGAAFGLLLALGGAAVFGLALLTVRLDERRELDRRRLTRLAAGAVAGAAVLVLVAGAIRIGDPAAWLGDRFDEFRNPPGVQVQQGPGRIVAFSSNNRWTWWGEAWRIFVNEPWTGTGAGSFELARRPYREDTQAPVEPHNLGLQALSETGVVGFVLVLAFAGAAVWVVVAALRRLREPDRAAAAALAAGGAAYLGHALVDIGWEYMAVSAPLFVVLGVLATAGRAPARRSRARPLVLAAAVLPAFAVAASLASPWLADRRLDSAFDSLARTDLPAARSAADGARALNPLALGPLHAQALIAEAEGDRERTGTLYREAVRLQPRNPEAWYQLGCFHADALRQPHAAFPLLDRSYALDRYGPSGEPLDRVRAQMENRAEPGLVCR